MPTAGAWARYRLLLRYARPHRNGWLSILGVTALTTLVALAMPWPLKVIVDHVLGDAPVPGWIAWLPGAEDQGTLLAWAVGAELILFALMSALDVLLTFLWIVVGQTMVYDLAHHLFARVQRRSLVEHGRRSVGDTMARVAEDAWCVHTVVDELLFTPLHATITIAGILVVMIGLDPGLTLIAVAVAPLMAAASLLLGRPVRDAGRRRRDVESRINTLVQQTLTGMPVVQAFTQERRQRRQFDELARAAIRSHVQVAWAGGLNKLASGLVATVGAGVVLLVGAHSVIGGAMTLGALLVFLNYLQRLQRELSGFTGIYTKLQEARASVDRVYDILAAPADVPYGRHVLPEVRGDVALEDVTFGYESERPVLRGVSLHARPGEVVAIVGATGAGKSTLAGLIPRFFDPDAGRVLLDGVDVRELRTDFVRRSVSVVLQESVLFPVSIAENIAFGRPDASRHEIEAAARAARAHDFISRLPEGYDTIVGERGATLSGGERQRIAIARALLKDAPVLILDEPTSALDAETEAALMDVLEGLMAGRTAIVIAHRLSTVRRADRIVVLDRGQVVETGTHEELLAAGGAYARLHTLQFGGAELEAVA